MPEMPHQDKRHLGLATMENIKLIVFDLDGTLVDSRSDIAGAVNFTLDKLGLKKKNISEIGSYIGWGVIDLIEKSLGKNHRYFLTQALAIFKDYYRRHSTDNSRLYPGVEETLKYYKQMRKIIVTNRDREFAEITLKTLGISGYFETIIGGDDLGCLKPSSCPLNRGLRQLKVNKNRAIMVGDMAVDIQAGKTAGISTCAVTYGLGKREDLIRAEPDFIINDIRELKKVVN
jgi:2-phosphoglycolate phosphatase